MRTTLISKLRPLWLVLCGLVLSSYSYSQEVVTGPFLIRDGIYYHQDTNELVTGIIETFHPNGQLRESENYVDGEPDGLHEGFWENGQLQGRMNFTDGKRDGFFERFHENGQLWGRGNHIDGKQDGLFEFFNENGNLTSTQTYRNGELVETNLNP